MRYIKITFKIKGTAGQYLSTIYDKQKRGVKESAKTWYYEMKRKGHKYSGKTNTNNKNGLRERR